MSTPVYVVAERLSLKEIGRTAFKRRFPKAYLALERSRHAIPWRLYFDSDDRPVFIDEGFVSVAYLWRGGRWKKSGGSR